LDLPVEVVEIKLLIPM